jgi:adenosine deaminase
MFHTNLLDEYERAWEWCDLDEEDLARLAKNSLDAALR